MLHGFESHRFRQLPAILGLILRLCLSAYGVFMRPKVLMTSPVPSSRASLLLLNRSLAKQELQERLQFRSEVFAERSDPNLGLVCVYCGKPHLVESVHDNRGRAKLHFLATLDHVLAVSNGGEVFDRDNVVVSCFPCNQAKGCSDSPTWTPNYTSDRTT